MSSARRGVALLLVVAVVGIAAVFGLALLSMSSLQSQAGATTARAAPADALAESGVNLALFYLQNPHRAPTLTAGGHWPGASGISFGASVPGSVDVTVTEVTNGVYDIVSVGRPGSSPSDELRRTMRTRVRVNTGFQAPYAAAFTGDITIGRGTRVIGALQTPRQLTVGLFGRVEGPARVYLLPILQFGSFLQETQQISEDEANEIPRVYDLHDYRTYLFEGKVYKAEEIASVLHNRHLVPSADNPGGVFWSDGDLELRGEVRVDGTLLVRGGRLIVHDGRHTITPAPKLPAMIVDGDVHMAIAGESLTVNGLVWMGGSITRGGLGNACRLEVYGSLIMGGGGSIALNDQGTIRVEHVPDKSVVPQLTKNVGQVPLSVTITSWNPQ